jgi:hypothetical protein
MGNFGCDFRLSGKLKPLLDEAGFRNIQCSRIKTPIGPWSGVRLHSAPVVPDPRSCSSIFELAFHG